MVEYDSNKAHYLAVTGIIIKNGKYLITKRSPNETAFPNKWTVPGGKLEMENYINTPKSKPGHPQWYNIFEELLKREVMEETGIKIKNIKYLTNLAFVRPDGIPVATVSLFADYHEGDIILNEESVDHTWVNLEEAKNYDLIEGIYDELEMVDKIIKEK